MLTFQSVFRQFLGLSILLVTFPLASSGQTTIANGNWSDATTWQGGVIPTSGQSPTINHVVTIKNGENFTIAATTLGSSDDNYGGIVVNSGGKFTVTEQIYSSTSSRQAVKIRTAGILTIGNINLNSSATGALVDTLNTQAGGTLNVGQILYTKTSGSSGGFCFNTDGNLIVTNGIQYTTNTSSSSYSFNVGAAAIANITNYTIFNTKGSSNLLWSVLGQLTFNSGLNVYGEGSKGYTKISVGNASYSGLINTYGIVTFKKSDDNNSGADENILSLQNGEFVVNGEFKFDGSNSSTVAYNWVEFNNGSPYTGLTKKFTVKGKLFTSRPYGKTRSINVTNGSAIGFYLSGTGAPSLRPDENNNFVFQNIIVDATGSAAYLDGALTNSNMSGTLKINAGALFANGSSNSNPITLSSYANQVQIEGTFRNINTDNVPYQTVTGSSAQVMGFAGTGIVEYNSGYDQNILTGASFRIPVVITTGIGNKFLKQSLDGTTRKVGRLQHKAGTLKLGYYAYESTEIDFKLVEDPLLSTQNKMLVIDSGAVVEITRNFASAPDFLMNSDPFGVMYYNMGYNANIPYQKVYAVFSDVAKTTNAPYGILRMNDSNKQKVLEASQTIEVKNYLELLGSVNFEIKTGSKVKLLSTDTRTAYIPTISGTITYSGTGKIQVQKYIKFDSKFAYRDFTSPIQTATLSDWQNAGMKFSGFTGSGTPNYQNYTFNYNESILGTVEKGFTAATNITNNIITFASGKISRSGWRSVQGATGGSSFTFADEGPIFQGDIDFTLSFTAGGNSRITDDGWNFIGNPYACPISWSSMYANKTGSDLVSDNTTNGIAPTIYVNMPEDAVASSYKSGCYTFYNAATGVGEPKVSTVSQYQGFWVKTYHSSSASTTFNLRISEGHKNAVSKSFLKSGETSNDLVVHFEVNDGTNTNILSFHKWENATTGVDRTYDVQKIGPEESVQLDFALDNSPLNLRVNAVGNDDKNLSLPVWFKSKTIGQHTLQLKNLAQFTDGFSCAQLRDVVADTVIDLKTMGDYVFVNSDTTATVRFELIFSSAQLKGTATNASCNGSSDGSIAVKVLNYDGKSTLSLFEGTTKIASYPENTFEIQRAANAGVYRLEIDKITGCSSASQQIEVSEPAPVTAKFIYTAGTNGTEQFMDESTAATHFEWSFGDNTNTDDEENPTHVYTQNGTYTVTLKAWDQNPACFNTYSKLVSINPASTGIADLKDRDQVNLSFHNGLITANSLNSEKVTLVLYTTDGKKIAEETLSTGETKAIHLSAEHVVVATLVIGDKISAVRLADF